MYILLQFSCQVQGKHRLDVNEEGAEPGTHQRLGVTEDMILQELVQHVEEVVLHERLNHQLVQVVLRGEKLPVNHLTHTHTQRVRGWGLTCTVIWNWLRERMYSISTAMTNL